MDADGRLHGLGGHVEVLAVDDRNGLYCRLKRQVPASSSRPTTLSALCVEHLQRSLPLGSLSRAVRLARVGVGVCGDV